MKKITPMIYIFLLIAFALVLSIAIPYDIRYNQLQEKYEELLVECGKIEERTASLSSKVTTLQEDKINLQWEYNIISNKNDYLTTRNAELNSKVDTLLLKEISLKNYISAYQPTYVEVQVIPSIYLFYEDYYKTNSVINQEHLEYLQEKYPDENTVWLYLTETLNYSNEVASAILGNMLCECGYNSLGKMMPTVLSANKRYYGICQWDLTYVKDIKGKDIYEQLNYLASDIEYQFNLYGKQYKKNFTYDDFIAMTDIKEAAKAFAVCYERCGTGSYPQRQLNALVVYSTFIK